MTEDQNPRRQPKFPAGHYIALYQIESTSGARKGKSSAGAHGVMQITPVAFDDLKQKGYLDKNVTYEDVAKNDSLNMQAGMALTELLAERYPQTLSHPQANALAYLRGGQYVHKLVEKHGTIGAARKAGALTNDDLDYLDNYNFLKHGLGDKVDAFKGNLAYDQFVIRYPGFDGINQVSQKFLGGAEMMLLQSVMGGEGQGSADAVSGALKLLGNTATTLNNTIAPIKPIQPGQPAPLTSTTPAPTITAPETREDPRAAQMKEDAVKGLGSGQSKGMAIAGNIAGGLGSLITTVAPIAMNYLAQGQAKADSERDYKQSQMRAQTFGVDKGFSDSLFEMLYGGLVVSMGPGKSAPMKKPVDKYEYGGKNVITKPVPLGNIMPAQTVKGELIYHDEGSVTATAAKKKDHAQMKDSDVTDTLNAEQVDEMGQVVSPGAYVLSNSKALTVGRDLAKSIILGISPAFYEEGKKPIAPRELNFGDAVFKKGDKRLTPAEMAKRAIGKYKVNPAADDIFERTASIGNKRTRTMILEVIKGLNDMGRESQLQAESRAPEVEATAQGPDMYMYGGKPKVKKYEEGDLVGKTFTELEAYYRKLRPEKYAFMPAVGSALSAATQAVLFGSSDPTVTMPRYSDALISGAFQPENVGVTDRVMRQNIGRSESNRIRQMENMGVSSSRAANMLSADPNVNALNNNAVQAYLRNIGVGRNEAQYRLQADAQLANLKTVESGNQNAIKSGLASIAGQGISSTANAMFNANKYVDQTDLNALNAMAQLAIGKESWEQMRQYMGKQQGDGATTPAPVTPPAGTGYGKDIGDRGGVSVIPGSRIGLPGLGQFMKRAQEIAKANIPVTVPGSAATPATPAAQTIDPTKTRPPVDPSWVPQNSFSKLREIHDGSAIDYALLQARTSIDNMRSGNPQMLDEAGNRAFYNPNVPRRTNMGIVPDPNGKLPVFQDSLLKQDLQSNANAADTAAKAAQTAIDQAKTEMATQAPAPPPAAPPTIIDDPDMPADFKSQIESSTFRSFDTPNGKKMFDFNAIYDTPVDGYYYTPSSDGKWYRRKVSKTAGGSSVTSTIWEPVSVDKVPKDKLGKLRNSFTGEVITN